MSSTVSPRASSGSVSKPGIAIVALAVVLDRITQGWARGAGRRDARMPAIDPRPDLESHTSRWRQHEAQQAARSSPRSRSRCWWCSPRAAAAAGASRAARPAPAAGDKWGGSVTHRGEPVGRLGGERRGREDRSSRSRASTVDAEGHRRERGVGRRSTPARSTRTSRCGRRGTRRTSTPTSRTKKSVVDGGLLGPTGHIGWYIPKFVADAHPEYKTWEGLKIAGRGRSTSRPRRPATRVSSCSVTRAT